MNSSQEGERIDLAREPEFALGPLKFVPSTRQLFANGETETLEPRVIQVLTLLAKQRGNVVSRDELVERCWEGRAISEDAINRSIAKVRRIAEGRGGFDLETIPRVGYRLSEHAPDAAAPRPTRRFAIWTAAAAALLLLGIGLTLWLTIFRTAPADAQPVSLAVLPFRNLASGDDYFAEGVAEEILTQLAREPGLRVAGRTSSWMFRGSTDPRDVGRRLDVAYILEGSVRRSGRQVRVDVALVGTRDGMRRWSQTFQGSLDDIFAIQSEIGNTVAGNLRREIVLSMPVPRALTTRGDVYNLYLTARGLVRTREPAKVEAAVELLRSAVRLDPGYAPAWAALATATGVRIQTFGNSLAESQALHAEARRHLARALALAPDLPEAHAAFSMIEPSSPETLRRLERAVQLEPHNAEFWYALGRSRRADLDYEGWLEANRRVAAIDPFWVRSEAFAAAAWSMGERSEALRYGERMIRDHPDPIARELARLSVAVLRRDWSEAYRLSREIDRLRPPQIRARSGPFGADPIYLRVRLNRLEEASQMLLLPVALDMIRGEAPRIEDVLSIAGNPVAFWEMAPFPQIVALRLNQHGRSADLLALYDGAFSSPQSMATDHPHGAEGFINDAPDVVVALREGGRRAEAERMLALADRIVSRAASRGRVPNWLHERAARIRALQGRSEAAVAALERAVAMGWQFDQFGMLPRLADLPVYRSIRNEPRLRRFDAIIQESVARERREAEALTA